MGMSSGDPKQYIIEGNNNIKKLNKSTTILSCIMIIVGLLQLVVGLIQIIGGENIKSSIINLSY